MNLLQKETSFAQPASRQVRSCGSESDRVCDRWALVQVSGGKEVRGQYYYYERMALLILIDKKLGQSPASKS